MTTDRDRLIDLGREAQTRRRWAYSMPDDESWPLLISSGVLTFWTLRRLPRWIAMKILRSLPKDFLPRAFLALYYRSKGSLQEKEPLEAGGKGQRNTFIEFNQRSPWTWIMVRTSDQIFRLVLCLVDAVELSAEVPAIATSFLRFKNTIGNENSSAMFYAAYFDMPYLLEFLIKLEQGQQGIRYVRKGKGKTPPYNLKSNLYDMGMTPVFAASTPRIFKLLLDAGFDDMQLISKGRENLPLLHFCTARGVLDEHIYEKLSKQRLLTWRGYRPLEYAMSLGDYNAYKLLASHNQIESSKMWGLFQRSGRDRERCEIFMDVLRSKPQRDFLKRNRRIAVLETCRGNHPALLESVMTCLSVTPQDLQSERGTTSPLWMAANWGNSALLECLLGVEGVFPDLEARDGTTAFDLAIGRLNDQLVDLFLTSPVLQPKNHMLQLLGCRSERNFFLPRLPKSMETLKSCEEVEDAPCPLNTQRGRAAEISQRYPYVNKMAEMTWDFNAKIINELFTYDKKTKQFQKELIIEETYGIHSPGNTFRIDGDIKLRPCPADASYVTKISYAMVRDMISFARQLELFFQTDAGPPWTDLAPKLRIAGSVAEGTRIGLANELDMILDFDGWTPPLLVDKRDPLSLYTSTKHPSAINKYLDVRGRFLTLEFMHDLLELVERAVHVIFHSQQNPPSLECVTTNKLLRERNLACPDCTSRLLQANSNEVFEQCAKCAYTVSQTKAGICLQFQWRSSKDELIYMSMDIIPAYSLQEITSLGLAKIVNLGMLKKFQPKGWFKYLTNYLECDMVMEDLLGIKSIVPKNKSVFLKLLHSQSDLHYVRPGQLIGQKKFQSNRHHLLYQHIKFFKKTFDLDINMFMVKKLLWKPEITMIYHETLVQREFVLRVISLPELRAHFEKVFDFNAWEKKTAVEIRFHPTFP